MTPRQAALHYAAALLDRQLAAAHPDRTPDDLSTRTAHAADEPAEKFNEAWWAWWCRRPGQPCLTLDTFEHAPPHVAAALRKGLDGEAVAEEMARVAEELRKRAALVGALGRDAVIP